MSIRMLDLSLLCCLGILPAAERADVEALRDAERAWYLALAEALNHQHPEVVVNAAMRIARSTPHPSYQVTGNPHRTRLRLVRPGDEPRPPAPPALGPLLLERLLAFPGMDDDSRHVRAACYAALVRTRHCPPAVELRALQKTMGKPAALLLASFEPHEHIPLLRTAHEAPDPIDLAHLQAWNILRVQDSDHFIKTLWSSLVIDLRVSFAEGDGMMVVGVGGGPIVSEVQAIGQVRLRLRPHPGSITLGHSGLALWPMSIDFDTDEPFGETGEFMPVDQARVQALHDAAGLDGDRHPAHQDLIDMTVPSLSRRANTADRAQARAEAQAFARETAEAWRRLRERLPHPDDPAFAIDAPHPVIRVRLVGDQSGVVDEWIVEALEGESDDDE